jgi:D-sedoheptulose 7-phosphate isomerase
MIEHVRKLQASLSASAAGMKVAQRWGADLADVLPAGGRLLVAGNGGSAAQAQHLSAELVGRYCPDRPPYSAIALHTDTSAVTAIVNDFGAEELFARQVCAHGRWGDVCLLMSTSGRSANLLAAARAAASGGMRVWAMTGRTPNPLAALAHETLAIEAVDTCTVQELHLVALHIVCEEFDVALGYGIESVTPSVQVAGVQ